MIKRNVIGKREMKSEAKDVNHYRLYIYSHTLQKDLMGVVLMSRVMEKCRNLAF